jgi:hypothetical protein
MSLSRLAHRTGAEFARAAVFSTVVAAVAGAVGFGLWSADISLVQSGVEGSAGGVHIASLLPAFFAAWGFFLLRRLAWRGPAEALAVGGAAAALAVVAHRNVLLSQFFDRARDSDAVGSLWVRAAFGGLPRAGANDDVLLAEVAVVVGVGLGALVLQRLLSRPAAREAIV